MRELVEKLAPPLEPSEQVYLQQLTDLAVSVTGAEGGRADLVGWLGSWLVDLGGWLAG